MKTLTLSAALLATAAAAKPPTCNDCNSVGDIAYQIVQKQTARNFFDINNRKGRAIIDTSDTAKDLEERVQARMNEWANSPAGQPPLDALIQTGKAAAAAGRTAVAGMTTDGDTCEINQGTIRNYICKEFADALYAHELSHKRTCEDAKAFGLKPKDVASVLFTAADEVRAYDLEIALLKQHLEKVAKNCPEWSLLRNVPPTDKQKKALDDAAAARKDSVKRATKALGGSR